MEIGRGHLGPCTPTVATRLETPQNVQHTYQASPTTARPSTEQLLEGPHADRQHRYESARISTTPEVEALVLRGQTTAARARVI